VALPDCVLTEATATGQAMAKAIYEAAASVEPECGNGVVEDGEECDDGNTNDADACRNRCKKAVCGDGVVAAGLEECDDGNTVPDDGCTDCKTDGATCGASGVDVVVAIVFQPTLNNLGGLFMNLGYSRAGVSIPGSADAQSVLDRVQDLTGRSGAAIFNDRDTDGDAVDDDLLNLYTSVDPIVAGPFEQVRFDCSPGSFVRPTDFDCGIDQPSDTAGNCLATNPTPPPACLMAPQSVLGCKVTRVTSAP
jgi:cysteine-rich repeat protein